ncbi:MAG: hypothetical protein JW809_12500 [Pirellulales bacterium]|nr:hypothetical protein [Pirellulales bacterium]
MELALAILTAALAVGFLGWIIHGRTARHKRRAGPLVWRSTVLRWSWAHVFAGIVTPTMFVVLFGVMFLLVGQPPEPLITFFCFFNAGQLLLFPLLYVNAIELREQGLTLPNTRGHPVLWSDIRYVKRTRWGSGLLVCLDRMTATAKVAPAELDVLMGLLAQRVEVRDEDDRVLNPDRGPTPARPRGPDRAWLQFSLQGLLLFTILAASASSWYGVHKRAQWAEEAALAELERFGPVVQNWPYGGIRLDFSQSATRPDDAALEIVSRLDRLSRLDLTNCPITDAGLAHLEGLASLEFLALNGTKITDAGLEHLAKLTRLKHVHLGAAPVTPAGVARLRKSLPNTEIVR